MTPNRRALTYVATAAVAAAIGAAGAVVVMSDGDTRGDEAAAGSPRAFPTAIDGYRLDDEASTVIRVFDDSAPQVIADFPATMNGCGLGRFVVRWRALAPESVVEFVPVYCGTGPDQLVVVGGARPERGNFGYWESSSSCEQPAWTLVDAGGEGSTLTDVTVEDQVWSSAP